MSVTGLRLKTEDYIALIDASSDEYSPLYHRWGCITSSSFKPSWASWRLWLWFARVFTSTAFGTLQISFITSPDSDSKRPLNTKSWKRRFSNLYVPWLMVLTFFFKCFLGCFQTSLREIQQSVRLFVHLSVRDSKTKRNRQSSEHNQSDFVNQPKFTN